MLSHIRLTLFTEKDSIRRILEQSYIFRKQANLIFLHINPSNYPFICLVKSKINIIRLNNKVTLLQRPEGFYKARRTTSRRHGHCGKPGKFARYFSGLEP